MFLNLSNHPLSGWSADQVAAAEALATPLMEAAFPHVAPDWDAVSVRELADQVLAQVPAGVTHAMVMGEMSLTHLLVNTLQARGVQCLVATTRRETLMDGALKTSVFRFVRFRAYAG